MKKIFITGGCGFIGSHIVDMIANLHPKSKIYIIAKFTYAAKNSISVIIKIIIESN